MAWEPDRAGRAPGHDRDEEDAALTEVIRQRLREAGLTAGALAERLELGAAGRDRFYKALRGERRLTHETLHLLARGLDVPVLVLRQEAGVLTPQERARLSNRISFAEYVNADPLLTPGQRQILIDIHQEFTRHRQGG